MIVFTHTPKKKMSVRGYVKLVSCHCNECNNHMLKCVFYLKDELKYGGRKPEKAVLNSKPGYYVLTHHTEDPEEHFEVDILSPVSDDHVLKLSKNVNYVHLDSDVYNWVWHYMTHGWSDLQFELFIKANGADRVAECLSTEMFEPEIVVQVNQVHRFRVYEQMLEFMKYDPECEEDRKLIEGLCEANIRATNTTMLNLFLKKYPSCCSLANMDKWFKKDGNVVHWVVRNYPVRRMINFLDAINVGWDEILPRLFNIGDKNETYIPCTQFANVIRMFHKKVDLSESFMGVSKTALLRSCYIHGDNDAYFSQDVLDLQTQYAFRVCIRSQVARINDFEDEFIPKCVRDIIPELSQHRWVLK